MNKKPSRFSSMLFSEQRTNRDWQEALNSPFSDLFDRVSWATKFFIASLICSTLGMLVWAVRYSKHYIAAKRQTEVALQSEGLAGRIEKILSEVDPQHMFTPEQKSEALKTARKKVAQLALAHPKNFYGYEAALFLAQLHLNEAIEEYYKRISEGPSSIELELQNAPHLEMIPVDLRRSYAYALRTAEHVSYSTAAQWLEWAVENAPDDLTKFYAQKELARVMWALGKFDEAFQIVDHMDQRGYGAVVARRLRGKFLKQQGKVLLALKAYEEAQAEEEKILKLLGQSGLTESARERLKLEGSILQEELAALKATEKVLKIGQKSPQD